VVSIRWPSRQISMGYFNRHREQMIDICRHWDITFTRSYRKMLSRFFGKYRNTLWLLPARFCSRLPDSSSAIRRWSLTSSCLINDSI
jgi:hypothetical protein